MIVGDRFILKNGTACYLVEVKRIDEFRVEVQYIMNANTGRANHNRRLVYPARLYSLEDFLDSKRQLIKKMEAYL